jgi:hypothetical protein
MDSSVETTQFVICIDAHDLPDIEAWKVYRVLPDARANQLGCLRVVDESGEDYLFPANRFAALDLSEDVRDRLMAAVAGPPRER